MRRIFLFLLSSALFNVVSAQLVPKARCGTFAVDILDGKVNGVKPNYTLGEIKKALPCFTSTEEDKTANCGRTVFFKDRDIYFYVDRNYVEIGPKFKGKLSLPLLGAKRNSLFKWLGNPKLKDDYWDAFETAYGTLVLHYDKTNKVILIQISTLGTELLNLCQ